MAESVGEEKVKLVRCYDVVDLGCSRDLDLSDVMMMS